MSGARVFEQLRNQALASRQTDAMVTTSDLMTRHSLEPFLDRLQRTAHGRDFVLKGGILLAGYGFRRPTKDVNSQALSTSATAAHVAHVVRDVAAVETRDGLEIELASLNVQTIREAAGYPGVRVRVHGTVERARLVVA